jgi:nucleosome binding factor SPN SPT16 subunit
VSHEKMANDVEGVFREEKTFKALGMGDVHMEFAEFCYTPSKNSSLSSFSSTLLSLLFLFLLLLLFFSLTLLLYKVIQSGGVYDLKVSAMSTPAKLSADVILCSLGVRYKSYCSNITRTFLVDPTPAQERDYKFLCTVHEFATQACTVGTPFKDIYTKVHPISNVLCVDCCVCREAQSRS